MPPSRPDILAIAVGNTRTRLGLFHGGHLHQPVSVPSADAEAIVELLRDRVVPDKRPVAVVIASVNPPAADALDAAIGRLGPRDLVRGVYRVGPDLPIPLQAAVDDDREVGHDRLLNALGAFTRARQACVVIDAGTAVTVDFVDGRGVFQGGAIGPGVSMMLESLARGAAALPEVAFDAGESVDQAFGTSTRKAMLLGVRACAVGMVHLLVDRYAQFYGGYPQIVATGGDAPALFENDSIVEHLVPDLQLIGIHETCVSALKDPDEDDPAGA